MGASLALDSNIVIQLCDDKHRWHESTKRFIADARERKSARLYYFLATKLEVLEYFRKRGLTLWFRNFYRTGHAIGGSSQFDARYARHELFAPGCPDYEYLDDRSIKQLRKDFLIDYAAADMSLDKAQSFWEKACSLALKGSMKNVLKALDTHHLTYAGLDNKDLFDAGTHRPQWKIQEDHMIRYGMGSSDAAIVNMATHAKGLHGIVSNDIDVVEFVRNAKEAAHLACYTFIDRYVPTNRRAA
jgi:hypothetical protein